MNCIKAVFGACLAIGVACQGENLVSNGNFWQYGRRSREATGWTYLGHSRGSARVDPSVRYGESASLRLSVPDIEAGSEWTWVTSEVSGLLPGIPYTLSLMVKTSVPEKSMAYASLNCYAKDGSARKRIKTNDSSKVVGDSDWTQIVLTIPELEPKTNMVLVHLCVYGSGTAWFTNVKVEAGDKATAFTPSPADRLAIEDKLACEAEQKAWRNASGWKDDATRIKVAILDMGLDGQKGEWGQATSPQRLRDMLAKDWKLGTALPYDIYILDTKASSNPAILNVDHFNVAIVPTGSWFPLDSADAFRSFLHDGGSMLTSGGYAFDNLLVQDKNGRWDKLGEVDRAGLKGTFPMALPLEDWKPSAYEGTTTKIEAVAGYGGEKAIRISTANMAAYNTGICKVPEGLPEDWSVISFWARGDQGTNKAWVEFGERDGSRWHKAIELKNEWTYHVLTQGDFEYWFDNPSVGRGGEKDFLNPANAASFQFGVAGDIVSKGRAHGVEICDVKVGTDPLRRERLRKIPQMNSRTGFIRDAIHLVDEQISAFDPSFVLENVSAMTWKGELGEKPKINFTGQATGYAAIGQLCLNGHGFGPNRAGWNELIAGYSPEGEYRGPVAAILRHYEGYYAGSRWAIFGVDNADVLDAPVLQETMKQLCQDVFLGYLTSGYLCYRRGETAELKAYVSCFRASGFSGRVRFSLRGRDGALLGVVEESASYSEDSNGHVVGKWVVPESCPDYLMVTAELLDSDGKVIDQLSAGLVIWTPSTLAKGPKLGIDGSYFTLDGQAKFWLGAQNFWGQVRSVTARSPEMFDRDFEMMRAYGMRWSRCFLTCRDEFEKRFSDAVVQLAQYHGIVLYHTPNQFNTADPDELARQKALLAEITERYKDVPGLAVDICNEQYTNFKKEDFIKALGYEPKTIGSWDDPKVYGTYLKATEVLRNWGHNGREGVRQVRKDVPVTVGWGQGWAGGMSSKDVQISSLDLDFIDRHYYGKLELMPADVKDIDQRVLGKPFILGECGAKCHPTWRYGKMASAWETGETEEEYTDRFRYLISHVFGMGGAALLAWHWRDPMEGIFPCGQIHSTWVPRKAAGEVARLAKLLGNLTLKSEPPDTVLLLGDYLRHTALRMKMVESEHAASNTLLWLGANYSLLPDGELGRLPKTVKTIIYPTPQVVSDDTFEQLGQFVQNGGILWLTGDISIAKPGEVKSDRLEKLCGVKAVSGVGSEPLKGGLTIASAGATSVAEGVYEHRLGKGRVFFSHKLLELDNTSRQLLRECYGKLLEVSVASTTRRPQDPESLETFRVPGQGATGWVFWNTGKEPVTIQRHGRTIVVQPRRGRYLQVADDGAIQQDDIL